jgi:tRNA U34 5-carboxymethylaminomethyl modifying GTPase MnmE/TrmE
MYDQTRAQQPPDRDRDRTDHRSAAPDALLPSAERDAVLDRLRKAINTFADAPHEALEEAEGAFDDAAAHLANALAERRRVLHDSWQDQDPEARAEELRIALRQYREITQRLIRL